MKDKPEQTPTPRTDAAAWGETNVVEASFARQLETELAAVTKERNEAREYADRLVEHKDMVCLPADLENLRKANAAFASELAAVTEQVHTLSSEVHTLGEQRDEALKDLEFRRDLYSLQTKQLNDVREQRDRLAEAMQEMWPFIEEDDYPACNTASFNAAIKKYKKALQSLNQPTP